jgi:ABC-type glycerol-3-phosphate transport system permease component
MHRLSLVKGVLLYVALTVLAVFCAFPFFWMVSSSLKSFAELLANEPRLLPSAISLTFYKGIITTTNFVTNFKNTIIVTVSTIAVSVTFASLAAYALARLKFRAKRFIIRGMLIGYMLPQILLVTPLFVAMVRLHLVNTYLGLVMTYVTFAFPFATWLLTAYYETISVDLEEAARIDGASNAGVFFRITLPLAGPGIAAAAIFSFIAGWTEFLYSFVMISNESKKTLSVGLYNLIGGEFSRWGDLIAESTMMVVPVVIFFFIVQRQIVSGLEAGALKG